MTPNKDHYEFTIKRLSKLRDTIDQGSPERNVIDRELASLESEMKSVPVSATQSVYDSHEVLCGYKGTNAKEAFNIDSGLMWAMGIAAESGELLNNLIKVYRQSGGEGAREKLRQGVMDEIPDVFIYMTLLCMFYDIDLENLVLEKSKIVVQRALDGHYGPPVTKTSIHPKESVDEKKSQVS